MRASQRPGASTSSGVGIASGRSSSGTQPVVAGAVDHALDERLAAGHLLLAEADAEQLLDEGSLADVSTRWRRTASAMRRASPPTTRTATASTTQSV